MALLRLADEGLVKKILFGVYYKSEYNELLGETVAPSPNKVAHALARNFGWTIVPCGDTALTIQALKALGKDNVSEQIICRLKKALSEEEKEKMLTKAKSATAWVYEYIKVICKGNFTVM